MDPAEGGRDPSMVGVSLWNSAVSLWMKAMKTLPPHQCSHFERFVSTADVSSLSVSACFCLFLYSMCSCLLFSVYSTTTGMYQSYKLEQGQYGRD